MSIAEIYSIFHRSSRSRNHASAPSNPLGDERKQHDYSALIALQFVAILMLPASEDSGWEAGEYVAFDETDNTDNGLLRYYSLIL